MSFSSFALRAPRRRDPFKATARAAHLMRAARSASETKNPKFVLRN